jgi:GTP-binding protein
MLSVMAMTGLGAFRAILSAAHPRADMPMVSSLFRHAQFEVSVADPMTLPQAGGLEIAFAGRSNAGKSSAINTLAGHTRLAYVSKTPGRTQLINLFRLKCGAALVDLPGYGYADVPEAVRMKWQGLLEHYLTHRAALAGPTPAWRHARRR